MRLAPSAAVAVLALLLPACTIHWGGDDDIYCPALDEGAPFVPDPGLLNPWTLVCESFGGGGCGSCGPCAGDAEADPAAIPSWGSCASGCEGLAEAQCQSAANCRTVYDDICLFTDGPCSLLTPFLGCYPIDQTGPATGACDGLDAWECSRHNDCLASYRSSPGCRDGADGDGDGQVDEADECSYQFGRCAAELVPECPGADCG